MAQANPRQNIKWDITTPQFKTVSEQVAKRDQRIKIAGTQMCSTPNDLTEQLKCTKFLYDSDHKSCTFKRFGKLGVCDYTPEGYANVVNFNAEARKNRKEKKYV